MRKSWLSLGALVAAAMFATASGATVVHDDAGTAGSGPLRGVGTVTSFFQSTGGTGTIAFDLFGRLSLDGDGYYKDVFTVALNGLNVFSGTWDMGGGGANVIYSNLLGWTVNSHSNGFFAGGNTNVTGLATLLAGTNTFSVTLDSPGGSFAGPQSSDDESWALNNVNIAPAAVPLPASFPLLALGLAGMGIAAARRKKA